MQQLRSVCRVCSRQDVHVGLLSDARKSTVVVSSSHKDEHYGRGVANGQIVFSQSDRPVPYRLHMASSTSITLAGGKEDKRKYADLPAQVTLDLLHVLTDVSIRASGA
jgi:hypothetical protein